MKFSENLSQRLSGRHYACASAIDYSNKKILNIGCGNGAFEFLTAHKAKEIVGVDIKYEDVLQAKEECAGLSNVNFVQANILEDDFPEKSSDIVVFFDAIEHLPKESEPRALKKINKILKPHGQIIISTPLDNITKFFDPAWYIKPQHRHYSKEQLVELLIDSGFEIEKIYTRGGFFEMASMLIFYPFKWFLNMEIPFKKFFDKKRDEEYKKDDGYVTLFVVASKATI